MSPVSDEPAVWLAKFGGILGADAVETRAAVRAFQVDGRPPVCVLFPDTVEALSRCAAAAHAAGVAVIPVGNGTQLGIGRTPLQYDVALSTRRLCRVLAHAAADMTVTVEAGLTLAELNRTLAAHRQRLPLDPPHPEYTTIGALIAMDASGPLRLSQGKVRDLLIGITVVLADGTVVKGGGRVVKNVAGYDLMKLFTGSFGTLGIIAEATFKVRPCPAHEVLFVLPASAMATAVTCALDVLAAPLAPLYVEALNAPAAAAVGVRADGPAVVIGGGGSSAEIAVQRERLEQQFGVQTVQTLTVFEGEDAAQCSSALRDFPSGAVGPFTDPALARPSAHETDPEDKRKGRELYGCKLSLLPSRLGEVLKGIEEQAARCRLTAFVLAHVGSGAAVIRFDGAATAADAFVEMAAWLRDTVRAAGGWVVFDALPPHLKARIDPWGGDVPALALMRGIKQTLDPSGRMSPGRFVEGI